MRSGHTSTNRQQGRSGATLLLLVGLVLSASAVTASAAAAPAAASVPPFDLLPAGPAPTTVPYGIGTRVYYSGQVTDLASEFDFGGAPSSRQFDRVLGHGGIAFLQFSYMATDCVSVIGRIAPASPYRELITTYPGCSRFDVSSDGLLGAPDTVRALRPDGTVYANYPRTNPGGSHGLADSVGAAGTRFVVEELADGVREGFYLWQPGNDTTQQLPDNYAVVGRLGAGWLGARLDKLCWKTAPATSPLVLRPPTLCSMAKPLLSADGTKAVLVQSGRVRVVDAITGALVSQASMPAISEWQPGNREAVPAAWESADSYLIAAKYDGALALVRCSVSTGSCNRAVRSTVRPGVYDIATERGSEAAVRVAGTARYPADLHDFNKDGKRDIAVWRPSNGTWYNRNLTAVPYGNPSDIPAAADYTVDGRTDIAVFRPSNGTWYIRGKTAVRFGQAGDVPVAADYTGDGLADLAVWRPSNGTWYVRDHAPVQYGARGDVPVRGDFDRNGFADYTVWRPSNGTWYIRSCGASQLGRSGDIPVAADYDGDDVTDVAVWRPSTGAWLSHHPTVLFGQRGDVPVAGDYNGDGNADIAVWRPSTGTWHIRGQHSPMFGAATDRPV